MALCCDGINRTVISACAMPNRFARTTCSKRCCTAGVRRNAERSSMLPSTRYIALCSGHGMTAQAPPTICDRAGQRLPPNDGRRTTLRRRCRLPPPHVAEHRLRAPQGDTVQSWAQSSWAQPVIRVSAGQSWTGLKGRTSTSRRSLCTPPPHVLEHWCSATQAPTLQATRSSPT